jgi:hypothetical protein
MEYSTLLALALAGLYLFAVCTVSNNHAASGAKRLARQRDRDFASKTTDSDIIHLLQDVPSADANVFEVMEVLFTEQQSLVDYVHLGTISMYRPFTQISITIIHHDHPSSHFPSPLSSLITIFHHLNHPAS